jgi:hypothetical protein
MYVCGYVCIYIRIYVCMKVTFTRRHVVPHYNVAAHSKRREIMPVKTQSFGYVRDAHSYDMPSPQVLRERERERERRERERDRENSAQI